MMYPQGGGGLRLANHFSEPIFFFSIINQSSRCFYRHLFLNGRMDTRFFFFNKKCNLNPNHNASPDPRLPQPYYPVTIHTSPSYYASARPTAADERYFTGKSSG